MRSRLRVRFKSVLIYDDSDTFGKGDWKFTAEVDGVAVGDPERTWVVTDYEQIELPEQEYTCEVDMSGLRYGSTLDIRFSAVDDELTYDEKLGRAHLPALDPFQNREVLHDRSVDSTLNEDGKRYFSVHILVIDPDFGAEPEEEEHEEPSGDAQGLRDIYQRYLDANFELQLLAEEGQETDEMYNILLEERDALWERYVGAGGRRPIAHSGATTEPEGYPVLQRGSRGSAVRQLQERLGFLEHDPDPAIRLDGSFGGGTHGAVTDFQTDHHLEVDGVVGQQTWNVLLSPAYLPPAPEFPDPAAPIGTGEPNTITIPKKRNWILALEATPQRSILNAFNLGTMAALSYGEFDEPSPILSHFDQLKNVARGDLPSVEGYRPAFKEHAVGYQALELVVGKRLDTQIFCVACDEHVIVACRGTQEPTDILVDITGLPVPFGYGPRGSAVHLGFYKGFERQGVGDRVAAFVRAHGAGKSVFLTGHSLGGALAVAAAARLNRRVVASIGCKLYLYTYGQPRVGDDDFARHFAKQFDAYWRYAHTRDVVPKIPLTQEPLTAELRERLERALNGTEVSFSDFYCHFGQLIELPRFNQLDGNVEELAARAGGNVEIAANAILEALNAKFGDINHGMTATYLHFLRRRARKQVSQLGLTDPEQRAFLKGNPLG